MNKQILTKSQDKTKEKEQGAAIMATRKALIAAYRSHIKALKARHTRNTAINLAEDCLMELITIRAVVE